MSKHTVTNISDGPRILNSVPPVTVQPGETVEAEISKEEVAAFEAFGNFKVGGAKSSKAEDKS